jgi:hypothetical protein
MKDISNLNKFKDLPDILTNFESFENNNEDNMINNNNQLFGKIYPSFDLVKKILGLLINYEFDDLYYEFTKKNITEKKIIEKINPYINDLKKYYLKCKHSKYLENIDEKKYITILRQILKPYNFLIKSYEKYNNGEKYLLYIISKNKEEKKIKKINSVISFD